MVIKLTPRTVIHALFKRWVPFVAFNVAVVVVSALLLFTIFWQFESTAEVVPNFSNEDLADAQLDQTTAAGGTAASQTSGDLAKLQLASMANTAASYDVERDTVLTVGLNKLYPKLVGRSPIFGSPLDAAIASLDNDLDVSVGKESTTLDFSLQNENPKIAQEALRVLIGYYEQAQAQVERDPRSALLKQQMETAQRTVDKAEEDDLAFKRRVNVSDLTTERSLLLNQRDDYQENLSTALSTLNGTTALRDGLKTQIAKTPENIPVSDENDETKTQKDDARTAVTTAEQSLLAAQQSYKKDSPLLKDKEDALALAKKQYEETSKQPAARVRTGPNPVWQSLDTQLQQTEALVQQSQAVVDTWQQRLKLVEEGLDHLNTVQSDEDSLDRQLTAAQTDYSSYLLRTEESRVKADLADRGASSLAVVQQPSLPYKPKRLVLVLAIGAAAALLGGVGLCLWLEVMDETIGMPQNVEPALGLPVLITLNQRDNGRKRRNGNGKRAA
jgi:polysaccharide biosynthesis protein PslE